MKKNWFTFLEILIAILVFSIWIFAVLSLVTNNLRWVERNDLRLQGTLFAKEWLELAYNLRDSNLERDLPWNCILSPTILSNSYSSDDLSEVIANEINSCINDCWGNNNCEDSCEINTICSSFFDVRSPIKISYVQGNYVAVSSTTAYTNFDSLFSWNKLYYHTWDWYSRYSHDPRNGQETYFARYLTFESVKEWTSPSLDEDEILKISSHVIWQKWSYTWEVVLSSFIWNY